MKQPTDIIPSGRLSRWRRAALVSDIHATQALFFPAAAAYGAVIPLLSMAAMTGLLPGLPSLAAGLGHAHEMLFGFALAVVAGYVTGPLPRWRLWAMFLLWLLARGLYLAEPQGGWTGLVNAAFAVLLAVQAAPRFASRAKKWRNQMLAPLLALLCASAAAVEALRRWGAPDWQHTALLEALLMLALLMLFMGGRIIAPAAAGQMQRQGGLLEARVQPHLEATLIVAMAAAVVLLPWIPALAAVALLAAAVTGAVRLWRWRLWECQARADLWGLGVGYAWLAAGLMLIAGVLAGQVGRATGIHALAVGALGSLTLGVMTRTRLQWAKYDPAQSRLIAAGSLLVTAAALLRVLAAQAGAWGWVCLWTAAVLWAVAFLGVAVKLARLKRQPGRRDQSA